MVGQSALTQHLRIDLAFRTTPVTVDRGGWYQSQFFKESKAFYKVRTRSSFGYIFCADRSCRPTLTSHGPTPRLKPWATSSRAMHARLASCQDSHRLPPGQRYSHPHQPRCKRKRGLETDRRDVSCVLSRLPLLLVLQQQVQQLNFYHEQLPIVQQRLHHQDR